MQAKLSGATIRAAIFVIFAAVGCATQAASGDAHGAGNINAYTPRFTLALDQPPFTFLDPGVGGVSDAAATAGGTGSLNAKLRLETTQLAAIDVSLASIDAKSTNLSSMNGYMLSIDTKSSALTTYLPSIDTQLGIVTGDLGAPDDSGVSIGGPGSISAKLRLISDQINNLALQLKPGATLFYDGYTVTATQIQLAPARSTRTEIHIENVGGAGDIYVGATSGVTAGNGYTIKASQEVILHTTSAIWAVSAGSIATRVIESY